MLRPLGQTAIDERLATNALMHLLRIRRLSRRPWPVFLVVTMGTIMHDDRGIALDERMWRARSSTATSVSVAVRSAQRGLWLVCVAVCASALAVGSASAAHAKWYVGRTSAHGARSAGSGSARVALRGTIRAAFYYPWFPQTWGRDTQNPFTNYVPTRGRYRTDLSTVRAQIADMQYARVSLGLASWFGQSSNTDTHWPALFQAARGTGFGWAPYYEREGTSDPTPAAIAADLHYLRTRYGGGRRWPCCRARACWCSSTTRTISTPLTAARR